MWAGHDLGCWLRGCVILEDQGGVWCCLVQLRGMHNKLSASCAHALVYFSRMKRNLFSLGERELAVNKYKLFRHHAKEEDK